MRGGKRGASARGIGVEHKVCRRGKEDVGNELLDGQPEVEARQQALTNIGSARTAVFHAQLQWELRKVLPRAQEGGTKGSIRRM